MDWLEQEIVSFLTSFPNGRVPHAELVTAFKTRLAGDEALRTSFKQIVNRVAVTSRDVATGQRFVSLKPGNAPSTGEAGNFWPDSKNTTTDQSYSFPPNALKPGNAPSIITDQSPSFPPNSSKPGNAPSIVTGQSLASPEPENNNPADQSSSLPSKTSMTLKLNRSNSLDTSSESTSFRTPLKQMAFNVAPGSYRAHRLRATKRNVLSGATSDNLVRRLMIEKCPLDAITRADRELVLTARDPVSGFTPLHVAALFGHVECLKHLLSTVKVDLSAMDARGITALHVAAIHWQMPAYGLLTRHLAASKTQQQLIDFSGTTPEECVARSAAWRRNITGTTSLSTPTGVDGGGSMDRRRQSRHLHTSVLVSPVSVVSNKETPLARSDFLDIPSSDATGGRRRSKSAELMPPPSNIPKPRSDKHNYVNAV